MPCAEIEKQVFDSQLLNSLIKNICGYNIFIHFIF